MATPGTEGSVPRGGNIQRYRTYSSWLRGIFGERVHKVIVDAGFTCPNRDGAVAVGGCTYCNNNSFRPPLAIKTNPISDQVENGIRYLRRRIEAKKFIVYFQPFTNTYADTDYLRTLYTEALDHPDVVGLAIGTRPDCVDEEKVEMIDEFARDTFVSLEFGVESIYDETLRRVNRGHDYAAFLRAMELNDPRQSRGLISVSPSKGQVNSRLKAADSPTACSAAPDAPPPVPGAECIAARLLPPTPPSKRNSPEPRNSRP